MTYALYELNEDGEAVSVHFYCSLNHAESDAANFANTETEIGVDSDYIDGTICEYCHNLL